MVKNRKKVFISYADGDRNKVNALEKALERTGRYEPVIVAKRRDPMKSLSQKVQEGISESDYLAPILSEISIANQWVNQEIGYAIAKGKDIFPIVDKNIMDDLKGFINKNIDLPFSFQGDKLSKHREAGNFRKCYLDLISYIDELHNKKEKKYSNSLNVDNQSFATKIRSLIYPNRVKQGETYTTTIVFQGKLINGFYDNYVEHLETKWHIWNWDPSTIENTFPKTPGNLHGVVNDTRKYTYDTKNWPIGKYRIDVRVYDHPDPNSKKRKRIIQESHEFEVLPL